MSNFWRHCCVRLSLAFALSFVAPVGLHLAYAEGTCQYLAKLADNKLGGGRWALPTGAPLSMTFGTEALPHSVVFLGKMIEQNGTAKFAAFFEPTTSKLHMLEVNSVKITTASGRDLTADDLTPVARTASQEGGTCQAFSVYNCLLHMKHRGHVQPESMPKLDTEQGRQKTLTKAFNNIYHTNERNTDYKAAQEKVFADAGYTTYPVPPADLPAQVLKYGEGWPVMIVYDVEWRAGSSNYQLMIDEPTAFKGQHWLPAQPGVQSKGRHAVLVLGVFEGKDGKKSLVVSDPNWENPVIWDASELSNPNIEAYVVYKKAA